MLWEQLEDMILVLVFSLTCRRTRGWCGQYHARLSFHTSRSQALIFTAGVTGAPAAGFEPPLWEIRALYDSPLWENMALTTSSLRCKMPFCFYKRCGEFNKVTEILLTGWYNHHLLLVGHASMSIFSISSFALDCPRFSFPVGLPLLDSPFIITKWSLYERQCIEDIC